MRLLLFDSDLLDHAAVRAHLESHLGEAFELIRACTLSDLDDTPAGEGPVDAVILAARPAAEQMSAWLSEIVQRFPSAGIVLITGAPPYSIELDGVDLARISILPAHQLARLPYMLQHHRARPRRHTSAVDILPDLPQLDDDVFKIVTGMTADYVYISMISEHGTGPVQYRSESLPELSGYTHEEINKGGPELLVHPEDQVIIPARRASLRRGEMRVDEFRLVTRHGRVIWIRDYACPVAMQDHEYPVLVVGAAQDITVEKLSQSRLAVQASILEMIARGEQPETVLEALNQRIEEQITGAIGSIQFVSLDTGELRLETPSRLPGEYADALQVIPLDPGYGPCARAAVLRELTLTLDVQNDPQPNVLRDLMQDHGIAAVWSTPIFAQSGDVAGVFSLSFKSTRAPDDAEIAMLESAAQLAGIVLDVSMWDEQRRLAEIHYQALVEQTPAITLRATPDDPCCLTYVSPQFSAFSQIPSKEILNHPERVRAFVHPEDRSSFESAVRTSQNTGVPLEVEFRIRRVSGVTAWVQVRMSLIRDQQDEPLHWLGVMLDVTDRHEAVRQMMESERRYRSLFDENLNTIVIYDYEGNVVDVNPAAERVSGYSREEMLGGPLLWMISPEDRDRAERHFLQARAGISSQFTITAINKQGERVELSASQSPVVVNGEIVGVSSIAEDVTEQRRLESQLLYQAYHDVLTGLPNRTYFDHMLTHSIETMGRGSELVILFMDLNNFKVINDSLGHDIGDKFLSIVGRQLRESVPDGALVSRFGGDEFTVLIPPAQGALIQGIELAELVISLLRSSVTIDGFELSTNVSIGIASTTLETICEPGELVRRADIALYDAKHGGRESNYRIFDERMDDWVFERLWIERDLRQALNNGEFVLHYQPIMAMDDSETAVVEALVRWNHPERGVLLPERFLKVAEETGHIVEIDTWVLWTACRQVAEWNRANPDRSLLDLGVNISARQFWQVDLVDTILAILEETGLHPSNFCIEITESTMMQDVDTAAEVVARLREHGVLIAIDDFGTGYSSLSYLRSFPIDVLKIDRTFISTLGGDEQQQKLVQAIISIARALNLYVVAEGVESAEHLEIVSRLGCDLAQGFYIAEPMPFDEVTAFLEQSILSTS